MPQDKKKRLIARRCDVHFGDDILHGLLQVTEMRAPDLRQRQWCDSMPALLRSYAGLENGTFEQRFSSGKDPFWCADVVE